MAHRIENLTVIFADICDSTGIVREHGVVDARMFFQRCLQRVGTTMATHGGRVVGRIGDELMGTVPDARSAIKMVLAIQDEVRAGGEKGEYPKTMRMHIGLNSGPVLIEGKELFGDTIHTAKRMVDMAKADQILTTRDLLRAVAPQAEVHFRLVDEIRIKGHAEPVAIFELMRHDMSATFMSNRLREAGIGEQYQRCRLRHLDSTYIVDPEHPVLTIGRTDGCDLTIPSKGVSRAHGKVEYQKGRIIYVDQSTNGTLVHENDAAEPVLIHNEQRWLRRHGRLLFAERNDPEPSLSLTYRCETL